MKIKRTLLFLLIVGLITCALAACSLGGENNSGGGGSSGKKATFTESMIIQNPTKGTGSYVYTGEPITYPESSFSYEVNGKYPSYSDFTYTYENNVNVGTNTAKLTIKAKDSNKYCTGSVVLYFSIVPDTVSVSEKSALISALSNTNHSRINLEASVTVDADETLTIPSHSTLSIQGNVTLTVLGTLVVEGNLTVDGSRYYQGGTTSGHLINRGSVESRGIITVTELGDVINSGAFSSQNTFNNSGVIYSNDEAISGVTNKGSGAQYVRQRLTEDDAHLTDADKNGVEFSQEKGVMRPPVVIANNAVCSVEYENNDHAGDATVTVTANERDAYFYGSVTLPFKITRGKATVSSYDTLAAAKRSGNYNRYEITGDVAVPQSDTLAFDEDETLNFAGNKLVISGAFINNGVIESYQVSYNRITGESTVNEWTLEITINEGGSFAGSGVLAAEKISVDASGDFTLNSSSATVFTLFHQKKGMLTVKSALTVPTLRANSDASVSIEDGGSITCDTLSIAGPLTNAGLLDVGESGSIGSSAVITNSGTIRFAGDVRFYTVDFSNTGSVVNTGEIVFDDVESFSNVIGGFDNSQGHIWTKTALENVDENVTVKKQLTSEIVALQYASIPYDGSEKKPTFAIEGESPVASDFTVKYFDSTRKEVSPKTVGEYTLHLNVKNAKCPYYGNLDLTYTITKGTFLITTSSNFKSSIHNVNFETVKLGTDVTVSYPIVDSREQIALSEGITLDTNGYSLTLSRIAFTVNGTLVLSAPTEDRKYSLLLTDYSKLDVQHVVSSGGVFVLASAGEQYYISSSASAEFVNDGVVYAGKKINGDPNVTVTSGTGTIYARDTLPAADLALSYVTTVYDGTDKEPTVSYVGSVLASGEFDAFGVTYSKNKNAGQATVTVTPDVLNVHYYGAATLPFAIEKASKEVTSLHTSDFSDSSNYYEVKLLNDVIISEDVVVPSNMSFNFSLYNVFFTAGRLLVEEGAVLRAEANTATTFRQNLNNVHEIKLLATIADHLKVHFRPINTDEQKIFLAKYYNSTHQLYPDTLKINNLNVDLNGYSLPGGFEIDTNGKEYTNPYFTLTLNNSKHETTTSVIGDTSSTDFGFVQKYNSDIKARIVVNLNNVTVAGIKTEGHNSGKGIQLNATDCIVQTAGTYALQVPWSDINADSSFTGCTFSSVGAGDVGNKKYIYLYSGTHVFTGCKIDSRALTYSDIDYRTGSGMHLPNVSVIN